VVFVLASSVIRRKKRVLCLCINSKDVSEEKGLRRCPQD
jgi:hypothetical protein